MANVFDNAVKGYTIGLNNKINAQKAYINSYLDGINARNAVNQEARTQDQYDNYIQPFQASNLGLTLAEQSLKTEMANDPTNRQYQRTITASDLGYRAGMGEQNLLNLPTDRNTSSNVSSTNNANSVFNKNASAFSLSTQGDLQELEKDRIEQLKKAYPLMNEAQLLALDAQINSIKNPPTVTATDGTPTTIMLPDGVRKPTGIFGENGRFNFTGTTTPASTLPSNPSNTQQTGQPQSPTGYENKYQYDERIRKENILKSIDTYQKLLDLAIQNGKKDDIAKYSGLLQATKNSLNNPLSNLYDRIFNNQSEADYNYQLNKRKLLGQ